MWFLVDDYNQIERIWLVLVELINCVQKRAGHEN